MPVALKGISARSWLKLANWTIFGTLWCILVSFTYNYVAFSGIGGDALKIGLISATILPTVLAGPLFFFLTLKLRELAIVNHKLNVVASTDSLTECLNRGAFAYRVDRELNGDDTGRPRLLKGALLVIDADHFKLINDSYGHDQGDEALRLIAAAIRGAVRQGDLVGRLGGEEFGVFLPGATQENAAGVAERIRRQLAASSFTPLGSVHPLTVSVGGASFERPISFGELFRIADRKLYQAKRSGRNRVDLVHVDEDIVLGHPALSLH